MSPSAVSERISEASPQFKARMAGVFYLLTILTGTFSLFGGGNLIVSGDAAATASNILANELLFRLSLVSNLIAGACYIVVTVLLYGLLKPVSRTLAMMAAFFSLAGCSAGALVGLFHLAPLTVLGDAYSTVFGVEQVQSLAYLSLRLEGIGHHLSMVFFGFYCLLTGYLIFKSTFMPKVVGALMMFAGVGWLTNSFANFLAPAFARSLVPYIIAPGGIGEVTLCAWLLVKGVNVQRWKEQANSATA